MRAAAKIDQIDARIAGLRRMREELARVVGLCVRLAGPLHLRRRVPGTAWPCRRRAAGAAARDQRRERRQHAPPDGARRRGAALAGRAARGAGAARAARAAAADACGVPLRVRLGARGGDPRPRSRSATDVPRGGGGRWCSGSSTTCTTSCSSSTCSRSRTRPACAPELIVVDSFPGKPSFHGLGELTAEELETLWETRRPATEAELAAAAAAWAAFRAPEPDELMRLAAAGTPELPLLAPALRRLLEELPAEGDGLSRTERQALGAIAGGARTPIRAFLASQEREEAPFLGDAWFFRTLAVLGQGPDRLVATGEGAELPPPPPLGDGARFVRLPIGLTKRGEEVLAGGADRVELVPLDRWLGGTHVTAQSVWRQS